MRKCAAFISILALVLGLCACVSAEDEITVISIKEGSFASVYDLDEGFGYGSAFLTAARKSGKTTDIPITAEMLSGFDTATTGVRKMHASYAGLTTVEWEYEVVYAKSPSKKILTSARLTAEQNEYPTGISRAVNAKLGSLERIAAATFTLKCAESFADASLRSPELEVKEGWDYSLHYVNAFSVRVLVYKTQADGLTADGELLKINIIGAQSSQTVTLTDIVLSDGVNDYELPDTEEV